jgi:hypothetical protein
MCNGLLGAEVGWREEEAEVDARRLQRGTKVRMRVRQRNGAGSCAAKPVGPDCSDVPSGVRSRPAWFALTRQSLLAPVQMHV